MRTGSVSFSVSALQPHRWAGGLSYHRCRISLFFRIANADILASRIANLGEQGKNDILSKKILVQYLNYELVKY